MRLQKRELTFHLLEYAFRWSPHLLKAKFRYPYAGSDVPRGDVRRASTHCMERQDGSEDATVISKVSNDQAYCFVSSLHQSQNLEATADPPSFSSFMANTMSFLGDDFCKRPQGMMYPPFSPPVISVNSLVHNAVYAPYRVSCKRGERNIIVALGTCCLMLDVRFPGFCTRLMIPSPSYLFAPSTACKQFPDLDVA